MNEDITFCDADCENMKCERNKKHIRLFWMPHSFARLEGDKDYCLKVLRTAKDEKKKKMTAKWVEYYVPCNDGSSRLVGYMCNDCGFIAVKKHWACPYCRAAMENADKVDEWAECYVEHYRIL